MSCCSASSCAPPALGRGHAEAEALLLRPAVEDADLRTAVARGIAKVNVNTELREAWLAATMSLTVLAGAWRQQPDDRVRVTRRLQRHLIARRQTVGEQPQRLR